jgi:hypothetical protein
MGGGAVRAFWLRVEAPMAIWNYRAELIPREWILKNYGGIPAVLDRERTIDDAVEDSLDVFAEEEVSRWADIAYPADFVARAEAILPATERSPEFVCCGRKGNHRIEIWIQDGRPDFFIIKLDMRQPNIELFKRIVSYARELDTLIMPCGRFNTVVPEIQALLADILLSRAYRFCRDPYGVLAEIGAEEKARRTNIGGIE